MVGIIYNFCHVTCLSHGLNVSILLEKSAFNLILKFVKQICTTPTEIQHIAVINLIYSNVHRCFLFDLMLQERRQGIKAMYQPDHVTRTQLKIM